MKTIDEEIKSKKLKSDSECNILRNVWYSKGFKSGVEFAQRWIPVEEELPEKNKNVLLKRSEPFHLYEITGFMRYGIFYSNETADPISKVTHWRPIELK